MNFKDQLRTASDIHKAMTGEIVTTPYIAAILWPNSSLFTQRSSMSQLEKKDSISKTEYIKALLICFPHSTSDFWLFPNEIKQAISNIVNKYTVDEIIGNPEISELYLKLIEWNYPRPLINKYL